MRPISDERELSQAEARQYQESYRRLLEDAPYGIYRSSLDGHFIEVNTTLVQMLGYASADELLTLDIARDVYVSPDDRTSLIQRTEATYERDPAGARWRTAEVKWRRKDGTIVTVRLSGSPFWDPTGVLIGFQMMAEDITERRHLEDQLRQSQKMEAVGQLTAGIAHDFNNLLTVILTNVHLIGDAVRTELPAVLSDLREVREAALRGAEMVRKLSAFGRNDPLALRSLELGMIVADTARMLRRVLPASIELRTAIDNTNLTMLGDPNAIEQILLNLATNARDAMPDGGTLTIETLRRRLTEEDRALHPWIEQGEFACLTVGDSGLGMDQRTCARLFEPFFTTKPRGEGTGLGMAMVYGLVKQHAGYIHVYSEVGDGTVMRIYFPLAATHAAHDGKAGVPTAVPGGSETVLVVEDEAHILTTAKRILEKRGYRVLAAADGVRALQIFREREPEIALIVTDMVMPRMGGRQLYNVLRAEGKAVRFLFTSGYTTAMLDQIAKVRCTVPFLPKPWTVEELLVTVRQVLDDVVPGSG
jgi:two-component system cell cycle sensor histidine kinase/response regulator CckA